MKFAITVMALASVLFAPPNAEAAQANEPPETLRLATCQDSWMDWKNDPQKASKFVATVKSDYKPHERDGSFLPLKPTTILGHDVVQLFPESVGMAVGFSIIVNASFDAVKTSLEKQMGKPFEVCEGGKEGKFCELRVAEKKTVMMSEAGRGKQPKTLFGCYYFYAK